MFKNISKILYTIGILIVILGITFISLAVYANITSLRLPGYILILVSWPTLLIAFAIDFRKIMILSKTAGDRYTLMSKSSLYQESEKRGLEPEKNKPREYYITILREFDEKILKELN